MILENLKKVFLKDPKEKPIVQTIPSNDANIDNTLSDDVDLDRYTLGYFDDNSGMMFNRRDNGSTITKQNDLIRRYRKAAMMPEVSSAIEEIVNEMSFVVDSDTIVSLDFNDKIEMNDNLKNSFIDNFEEILKLLNFRYNADSILKQFYIDGQVRFGCSYNEKNIKNGISAIHVMSPINLFYHKDTKTWRYYNSSANNYDFMNAKPPEDEKEKALILTDEELVTIDSGLYSEGVILSHLHTILKITNQLQSLEDMLIPLRFSRSVSRRVFNIDVGDLPYAKSMQAVKDIQDKFKYKKYYDVENGTIANSSNIASIVEDYYFPNRGGKGTSVQVLDEAGNLGETGDLDYFTKKLYSGLKVPLGRISGSDKGNVFDFTSSQIEQDEIRFFAFINRLRQKINNGFYELLKRHMVSKGLITPIDFDDYKQYLIIRWEKESNFVERQEFDILKQKVDIYNSVKDLIGELYSKEWVLKNVMKMSEEEILQMKKEMEAELLGKDLEAPEADEEPEEETPPSEEEPEPAEEPETEPEEDNEGPEEFGGTMGKEMKNKES